jgi:hypothetical protein
VEYGPYPGDDRGLSEIPWARGEPHAAGLVALLWYWPQSWQRHRLRTARIFTGGVAPAGYNVKILWMFVSPRAVARAGRELVVRGRQLDGPGTFRQRGFDLIDAGQGGPPSYASIIDVPSIGCWRLRVNTGGLRAHIDVRAVSGRS